MKSQALSKVRAPVNPAHCKLALRNARKEQEKGIDFNIGIARRSSRVPDSPKNEVFFLKKELCGQLESVFPGYQRQNVAHLLTYWAHIKAYLSLILNIIELK